MTKLDKDASAPFVHPTAIVEEGAKVGKYTKIWFFSHVAPGAVIGENCSLGQNTYVEWNAIVGNGCRLGNSVSIYSHVELEDFVFCAPYMVFTHISFPRAAVNRHAVFKKTLVKTGTTLGANSTVVPDVTCGVGTFLAAGATPGTSFANGKTRSNGNVQVSWGARRGPGQGLTDAGPRLISRVKLSDRPPGVTAWAPEPRGAGRPVCWASRLSLGSYSGAAAWGRGAGRAAGGVRRPACAPRGGRRSTHEAWPSVTR